MISPVAEPKYDPTPDSTAFHPCAIMGAASFSDFCWPTTFLLYKCDCFSEVDIKVQRFTLFNIPQILA